MALNFEHRGDHALVTFSGELTVPAVLELVGLIDGLIDNYFYRRVELILSSHGGVVQAANPYFAALARWRARDVHVCTRVFSSAASLAAVLFSVGDDRVADPHASLLYHFARVPEARDLTARDTVNLNSVLSQLDDRLVTLLVERAIRGRAVSLPAVADPADGQMMHILVRELSLGGRARKSDSAQARALARYVERAVRDRDREALGQLYRCLLQQEISISPHLACSLCLADRVAEQGPASEYCEAACEAVVPALVVPEWRALYPPVGEVPRVALTRHALVLGETGSGKTMSAILPVVAAMARAPHQEVGGGLIVDPKRELAPILRGLAGDRVQHLEPERLVLNLMDGPRWSLAEDLAAKRWVTAAVRIMFRMRGFVLSSPLRVLGPHEPDTANSEFFDREGCQLLRDVIAFILVLLDPQAPPLEDWLPGPARGSDSSATEGSSDTEHSSETEASTAAEFPDERRNWFDAAQARGGAPQQPELREWVDALHARARGADGKRGPNIVALAAWALGTPLVQAADSDSTWLWSQLGDAAMPVLGTSEGEARDLLERVLGYWRTSASVDRQHMGVVASARAATHEFADPSVERTLYLGTEPGFAACRGTDVDFARLVACGVPDDERPRFVLYQPARDGGDSLVAAALKARFFESVFADADRQTGRPDLPLVGYIADEAHRYLTSDVVHGEASFLDSARSFGCFSVLATQSLASIEHALAQRGGGHVERSAALAIVWTNTGTKLVFRTTDERTAERVQEMVPYRPGYAPVTRVRPLSALATGACYAFLPDGTFALSQLTAFEPEALALAPSEASETLEQAPGTDGPSSRPRRKRRRGWNPRSRLRMKRRNGRGRDSATLPESRS